MDCGAADALEHEMTQLRKSTKISGSPSWSDPLTGEQMRSDGAMVGGKDRASYPVSRYSSVIQATEASH